MPDCSTVRSGFGLSQTALQYAPALLGVTVLIVLLLAMLALAARSGTHAAALWRWVRQHRALSLLLALVVGLGTAGVVYAGETAARQQAIDRQQSLVLADSNILPNPQLLLADSAGSLVTWEISGTARLASGNATQIEGQASSSLISVRPGQRYCYAVQGWSDQDAQIGLEWHAAAPRQVVGWSVFTFSGQPGFRQGALVAPAGAQFVRVILRSDGSPLTVDFARVADAGVRVDMWPDGAKAALAFSFDWESAMGGLIHSWAYTEHDVADATRRGLNMRAGADFLLDLFAQNDVRGTFYGTGYNLLDGNTDRRTFAGNPTYTWANTKNRWASDYWKTHPWYGDDPFGTVASDPAWYFGDQTRRLVQARQEIGSHTFGHLYVRGTTPEQLDADAEEWDKAADAIGVPRPTTFAFPWQSSNSVTPEFYQVLQKHGINSVTRLFPTQLATEQDPYQITALSVYTPFAVMPDFMLGPATVEGEGSGQVSPGQAMAIIDEAIRRGGATSFWNHPEVLVDPATQAAWRTVVEYAAGKAKTGDLYIAPVGEIVQWGRDVAQVRVRTEIDGSALRVSATNGSAHTLTGVTLLLPAEAAEARSEGEAITTPRPDQVVLPDLAPGQTIVIHVKLRPQ